MQGVAQFMNCSVQEVFRLTKESPEMFENVLLATRAENIVERQLQRERARGG